MQSVKSEDWYEEKPFHHGKDFAKEPGTRINTNMRAPTSENIQTYLRKFSTHDWDKIDFRKLSKVYNSELKKYDFSLNAIFSGK